MQTSDLYLAAKSTANSKAFMEGSEPSIGTRILDNRRLETFGTVVLLTDSDNASHRQYISHRFDTTYPTDSTYSNRKIYKIFGYISNRILW